MVRRLSNSHAKTLTLSDSRFDFAIDFLEDTSQYGIGTTTLQQDGEPLVTLSHSIRTRFNEEKEDFFIVSSDLLPQSSHVHGMSSKETSNSWCFPCRRKKQQLSEKLMVEAA